MVIRKEDPLTNATLFKTVSDNHPEIGFVFAIVKMTYTLAVATAKMGNGIQFLR